MGNVMNCFDIIMLMLEMWDYISAFRLFNIGIFSVLMSYSQKQGIL